MVGLLSVVATARDKLNLEIAVANVKLASDDRARTSPPAPPNDCKGVCRCGVCL